MRHATTVNDENLKNGLAWSAGMHILLFLFLIFGFPHMLQPLPAHHEPVPFQIVTLADITNTRVDQKPEEPKPPAPPPQEVPPAQPAPTPPPPPQAKAPPAPTPPAPPVQQAEALLPKPTVKPKPVEKPTPPQESLASVLKDVAKLKPVAPAPPQETKAEAKTPAAQPAASAAPSLSTRLTISEEDALRRQIEQCWNPPIGARDAQTLIVELVIDVNPDRTVINTDIVDKARYNTDSFFRAAADSAVRAVRSPRCSPLELPADKYEQWKRIDFTFDPRDML